MAVKKSLRCGTVFPGCNYVAHGETEADVLAKIAEHARQEHGIEHISTNFRTKIVAHMQSEGPS